MIFNKNQTTPYFYIIRHRETKIMYAGSRYAKGCNPDEFMKPNGYQTSSPTIHTIIEEKGLFIFEILRIDTNLDGYSAYEYESSFLQTNNSSSSCEWYNQHNNDGMAFGTAKFEQNMMNKYGVSNPSQSEEVKLKKMETYIKNFGVENPSQSEEVKLKKMETCLEHFGVEYAFQSNIVKEKIKNTCLEHFGVENPSQSEEVKLKKIKTCLKNFGVEYPGQSKEVIAKRKETCIVKYGVEHPIQLEENRTKMSLIMKNAIANGNHTFICEICNREIKMSINYTNHLAVHKRKGETKENLISANLEDFIN